MTHVFVAFKIKSGGEELASGGLVVNLTESSVVLENSRTGEILFDMTLSNKIDVGASTWTCSSKRIDIKLKKASDDLNWVVLEQSTSSVQAIPATASTGPRPSYPSSSKVKRDWNSLDKQIDSELSKEKPEGDAALNGLFKQIYERSDEETKRAMIKSYQTSGGTVLSTNWGEVASKDYEGADRPEAPDGQQWASLHK